MAENKELEKLLWMFRQHSPDTRPVDVRLDPVDAIYHLRKNTRNPYLQRAIAPETRKREKSAPDAKGGVRKPAGLAAYEVAPRNQDTPFLRRSLNHPQPPATARREFQEPGKLNGDSDKLPWMIHEFYQSILTRLRENPKNFDAVVEELLDLFHENSIKIKLYEAYYTFQNWDQMMDTLEEVSQYPSPETFDLFCSALLTYYELVYPPEQQ
ncbi:MAG: hypothetical protein O7A69_00595 [SAR324 cluster bacterium]|nr:hypothetical protein [SAR324 cluster bacterium]